MALRVAVCWEVSFHDVDMMGIVCHGRVAWAEMEWCDVIPEAMSTHFEGEPWDL